jgi:hypothetical protein
METESECTDLHLAILRQCGILPALRCDNAASEMSQRVRQIHPDQLTKPHSLWQNPAELIGFKYLKYWTGAPIMFWFLAQDYLAHVHNLRGNHQINFLYPGILLV